MKRHKNCKISPALIAMITITLVTLASGKIIYVDDDAAGANDGTSWENAYIYLQDALADANDSEKPTEIRVAQGVYKPDGGIMAIPEFDWRTLSFQLINGVTLKGGYAGLNESDPNARDVELYGTILSGDIGTHGDSGDNSYHVVTGSGTNATAVLDGFTITGGNANGPFMESPRPDRRQDEFQSGAGMYIISGDPTVANCTFIINSADAGGGGMYNYNSSPIITNCIFSGNSAGYGGGMRNYDSNPTITNCTFVGNTESGMNNVDSNPTVTNCSFSENSATQDGGGMCNHGCDMILTGCVFIGNSAESFGGGVFNYDGKPTLTNCIFTSNSAGIVGGGMYNYENSVADIVNCTFSGNSAELDGGGIGNDSSSADIKNSILWGNNPDQIEGSAEISYSDIEGGWPEGGIGIIGADPLFADPNNGDYHLKSQIGRWTSTSSAEHDPNSGSWIKDDVTSPCIDAGDPNSDFSGEIWPHGGRINMGAYGGTQQASMSMQTNGMSLPRVAFIYKYYAAMVDSFKSLLETYGVAVTAFSVFNYEQVSLADYDLIIVADNMIGAEGLEDGRFVNAVEDSGKPVIGLGDGGYDFFGELGLSIGNPYGGHGSRNSIRVIEPEHSLFSTPYPIEIPDDRVLQLYTETDSVAIYLWPDVPETITVFGSEPDDVGYFPLVMEHNRYLLWGFDESPQKMTENGKRLFINLVIWTANAGWESYN